jgi:hypothetical protein
MSDFLMPDLSMRAIAVLFQVKWRSTANRPADFLVKESLASFLSGFEEDDVGFFYDPTSRPEICTHPGQLVGKITNSRLPYQFNFATGVDMCARFLNSLDDSYRKIMVIITDCFDVEDADRTKIFLSSAKDTKPYVFGVGQHCHPSLDDLCHDLGVEYVFLKDVEELDIGLKSIQNR